MQTHLSVTNAPQVYAESLYTGSVRGPALLVTVLAGCGFHVSAGGTEQPGDSAQPIDAAIDAPPQPDAFVPLPACMTSVSYANGPGGHRYRKAPPTLHYDDAIDA